MPNHESTERCETTALFYLSRLHLYATHGPLAGHTFLHVGNDGGLLRADLVHRLIGGNRSERQGNSYECGGESEHCVGIPGGQPTP